MASLLDTLVGSYATLFCMNERSVGSPQMSAKVHAPSGRRPAAPHKKPAKRSIDERLRALIGPVVSEEELEQRVRYLCCC
jgi:hypothetical protein